jgi:hypothetical protein
MIDFSFPPEVDEVRLKVRDFMDKRVRPEWDAIDQNTRAEVVKTILKLRKEAREEWQLCTCRPAGQDGTRPDGDGGLCRPRPPRSRRAVRAQHPSARRAAAFAAALGDRRAEGGKFSAAV